ncbi:MAG: cytochrome P450 [Gammaproteobacteria bacterium]|nr:cytochrome P450 [Gammaproteobacteria bacterium]
MNAVTPLEPNAARDEAWSLPLEDIDVSDPVLHQNDTIGFYFDRLREECPVHFGRTERFGDFWSVTRYKDIMAVDTNHAVYSSEPAITIRDVPSEFRRPNFITMDPPKHDHQRKAVSPIVAPANLARMESTIRERTQRVLDGLPVNEEFDWVEHVSIELTTLMLATLFDFPLEDRKLLTYWSDVATVDLTSGGPIDTDEKRIAELTKCLEYFTGLWNERVNEEPRPDLISMMSHAEATRNMDPHEFLGNLILLIVGGNDTTRNSMSGSIVATNRYPDEDRKVRAHPELIASSFVPEIIRWQTPLAHMRRTVKEDTEINGQPIEAGDKVIMWYLSGNRDADAIEDPYAFIADRARPRQHLSFGFGIHRCVGNRLAELQLKILWEEIHARFSRVEMVGEPKRTFSNFVHGWTKVPVRVHA